MGKKHHKNPFPPAVKEEIVLTNAQIRGAFRALRELCATVRMPVRTALLARELLRALQPKAQDVEDVLAELTEEYGRRDEEGKLVQSFMGGNIATELEDTEAFRKESDIVLETEHVMWLAPLKLSKIWRSIEAADLDVLQLDALLDAGIVTVDISEDEPEGEDS